MKSRTSCFNGTILRKDLVHLIPLVIAYFIFWLLTMPIRYAGNSYNSVQQIIGTMACYVGSVVNLLYAIAVAMVLFSYLYNARSANMIHAFPIRRDGLFLTHVTAGLLVSVVPNLLITLLTMLTVPNKYLAASLSWLVLMTLQYLFFFGFAAFLAQLTGHILALPIIYLVLNFAVIVQEAILRQLLPNWIFGMTYQSDTVLDVLSPVVFIWEGAYQTAALPSGVDLYHILIAIAGLILLVGAWLLYRHREIERAGDVIAIRALRPVFLVLVTIGCAIVLGYLISVIVFEGDNGSPLGVTLCMLIGAFFGYFGSQMALKQKINVFKKEWLGYGICAVAILAVMAACRFDLFGFSRYVPDESDIAGVRLYNWSNGTGFSEDSATIHAVRDIHQQIVSERPCKSGENSGSSYTVSYRLKNGKIINRKYDLDFWSEDLSWEDLRFAERFNEVYTLPELRLLRNCPNVELTRKNVDVYYMDCYLGSEGYHSIYLPVDELLELYYNCIIPDIKDGTLCPDNVIDSPGTAAVYDEEPQNGYSVSFRVTEEGLWNGYFSYNITPEATRSFAFCESYVKEHRDELDDYEYYEDDKVFYD